MLYTLLRLLREEGFANEDSETLLKIIDQEISRLLETVRTIKDAVDPNKCPGELLDFLASLVQPPFLPDASFDEKLVYAKSLLGSAGWEQLELVAGVLGEDISDKDLVEARSFLAGKCEYATPEQIDRILFYLGASYSVGITTEPQKRLAIKNAVPYYKIRSTEDSYKVLFRTFGLEATIYPLYTKDYVFFSREPEGSDWYPTPHYELELSKREGHGSLTKEVLDSYLRIARKEVQPIQGVLDQMTIVPVFEDTVEISDTLEFESIMMDTFSFAECSVHYRGLLRLSPYKRTVGYKRDSAFSNRWFDVNLDPFSLIGQLKPKFTRKNSFDYTRSGYFTASRRGDYTSDTTEFLYKRDGGCPYGRNETCETDIFEVDLDFEFEDSFSGNYSLWTRDGGVDGFRDGSANLRRDGNYLFPYDNLIIEFFS